MKTQVINQTGAATLLMSMVILFIIGLITIYSAQVSVVEQKISANHYRTVQAFEAAQAGMELIIQNLSPKLMQHINQNANGIGSLSDLNNNEETINSILTDSKGQKSGRFEISFRQAPLDNSVVEVTVNGFSADNNSPQPNQIIRQNLLLTPLIRYQPPAPVIARNNVYVASNDVTINNITGDPSAAIWSGGSTTVSDTSGCSGMGGCGMGGHGSGSIVSANINVLSGSGISSGTDTTLNQLNADKFFENFFSETRARIKEQADVKIDCSGSCTASALQDAKGNSLSGLIWVDTFNTSENKFESLTIDQAITIGSQDNPVLLIVNGNIQINHPAASLYGIIYTTGSFNNGNGAGNIDGSLISEENIQITGQFELTYNNPLMENLQFNTGKFVPLAGSWRDF